MDSAGVSKAPSRPESALSRWRSSPPGARPGWQRSLCAFLIGLVVLSSPWLGAVAADEHDARRVTVGINIFPAVLAADRDIELKRGTRDALTLLIVHRDEQGLVERLADVLRDKGAVRGVPIRVEAITVDALASRDATGVAGVFLAQRLGDQLPGVTLYCREHRVLCFSPFEGDVERGIAAGIVVSDRVLPYINVAALDQSGLRIKPFFMRIAERYE